MHPRSDAMINGGLIAIGILGILDNVLVHWMWQLHRAMPGPNALFVEILLVIVSAGLVSLGAWREFRIRKRAYEVGAP
jgi:uncharacterized membrane protein